MTSRTISDELSEYLNALLQFNPVFFSVVFVAVVILVIHVINQRVIIPSKIKYMEDKKKLENENLRLMALFAELDPDPVLRVNSDGVIIHYNKSAENLLGPVVLRTTHVSDVIPGIKNVSEAIKNDLSSTFFLKIKDHDYSTLFRGISDLGFAQIYFHDITERKNYERKLKQFSRDLQDSLEEERKRIAFELHDGIGQNLSLVKLKIQRLSSLPDCPERYAEFACINDIIVKTIKDIKDISYNLKPRILDELGLEPALISLCNSVAKETSMQPQIKLDNLSKRLNSKQELCLYRIAQEALSNIAKHSDASEFNMMLLNYGDSVKLLISDDGKGFDYEVISKKRNEQKNLGMISMMERAESLYGKLSVVSYPNEGTVILAEIPVDDSHT